MYFTNNIFACIIIGFRYELQAVSYVRKFLKSLLITRFPGLDSRLELQDPLEFQASTPGMILGLSSGLELLPELLT